MEWPARLPPVGGGGVSNMGDWEVLDYGYGSPNVGFT